MGHYMVIWVIVNPHDLQEAEGISPTGKCVGIFLHKVDPRQRDAHKEVAIQAALRKE